MDKKKKSIDPSLGMLDNWDGGNIRSLFFTGFSKAIPSLVLFRICSISMNNNQRGGTPRSEAGCNLASGPIKATKRARSRWSRYKKRSGTVTVPWKPRIPSRMVPQGSGERNLSVSFSGAASHGRACVRLPRIFQLFLFFR